MEIGKQANHRYRKIQKRSSRFRMAERREERDLSGAGGLNNPLLDDLLLSAAAAAASGSNQPNSGNMPGPGSQQQQYQYQSWTSSFDHLNLPSAYSGWYGQPTGMNFGTGADLLSGSFPHYDDLLQATVNQGTVADDPLLSKPAFYGSDGPPSTSVPTRGNMSSGTFHATQQGMVFPPPGGTTPSLGGGGGFQMGEQPAEGQGSYVSSANDFAFPNAAADGRSMYADAMNRWDMYQGSIFSAFQEPKPVDPSPWENQNLNRQTPVVTSSPGFIHSPPPPIPTPPGREVPQDTRQSVHGIANVTDQSVKNLADQLLEGIGASSTTTATTSNNSSAAASSPSPQQPSTANTNALNSRPSYSDVAKTCQDVVFEQYVKAAAKVCSNRLAFRRQPSSRVPFGTCQPQTTTAPEVEIISPFPQNQIGPRVVSETGFQIRSRHVWRCWSGQGSFSQQWVQHASKQEEQRIQRDQCFERRLGRCIAFTPYRRHIQPAQAAESIRCRHTSESECLWYCWCRRSCGFQVWYS